MLAVALLTQTPYAWAEEAAGSSSGTSSDTNFQQYEENSKSDGKDSKPENSSAKPAEQEVAVPDDYVIEDDTAVLGLCQVSFPTEFPFVIDPYEIARRGSVYSEPVTITNNGDEAVTVYIEQLSVTVIDEAVTVLTKPAERSRFTSNKEIQISMFCSNGDMVPLEMDQENTIKIPLQAKQAMTLFLKGSVTIPQDTSWSDGDVRLAMQFRVADG